ncbi:MAG: hypothetical protein LBM02_06185 [Lachnospiraceae bacterium]|jgi:hypothetical protein|nr:hypothetical protein [Lachnospiraceae bacterium]
MIFGIGGGVVLLLLIVLISVFALHGGNHFLNGTYYAVDQDDLIWTFTGNNQFERDLEGVGTIHGTYELIDYGEGEYSLNITYKRGNSTKNDKLSLTKIDNTIYIDGIQMTQKRRVIN